MTPLAVTKPQDKTGCAGCDRPALRTYCCSACWHAHDNDYDLSDHTGRCDMTAQTARATTGLGIA